MSCRGVPPEMGTVASVLLPPALVWKQIQFPDASTTYRVRPLAPGTGAVRPEAKSRRRTASPRGTRICFPSGIQTGVPEPVISVTRRGLVPSAFMIQKPTVPADPSELRRANKISRPSGDHAGSVSDKLGSRVNGIGDAGGSIRQMCEAPPRLAPNTTALPSGLGPMKLT